MEDKLAHRSEDGRTQTVAAHLQGTAALAAQFAGAFGAAELGRMAGLLHDIGKYSDAFQRRIRDPEHTARVDHSTAGAKAAREANPWLMPVAFAVAGHHTGLPDLGAPAERQGSTLFARLNSTPPGCAAWKQEITLPAASLPDFCQEGSFTTGFFTRMLYSCLVDADYLDTETFMLGAPAPRGGQQTLPELLETVRAHAAAWLDAPAEGVNGIRNEVLRALLAQGRATAPGLYTLTVPTGGGKTFASLAFALEHAVKNAQCRVVYVIPYTSIIDQTAEVFSSLLGPDNVLAHHSGADYLLQEKGALSAQDYRHALAAENWDAPVVATTAVQFFESLFAARASRCRKLHNLAGSVIVLDEAQTLPLPYLRPCIAALSQLVRHYGATVVLCTATQPALDPFFADKSLGGLAARELCPRAEALYERLRRTTLTDLGALSAEALALRLSAHKQVLCVVNRRSQAQQLFAALPEEGRYCLTTLLCAAGRKALLAQIRARLRDGLPCRVVSTSLIEAGVDVDFPAAYRERAGLDSVLQTAGRCNRNGRRPAAESVVALFSFESSKPLEMLRQQVDALDTVQRTTPALDSLEAIRQYFEHLYALRGPEALDQKAICARFAQDLPFETVAEDFRLIETPTRTVYLPVDEGAALCARLRAGEHSRALYRRLGVYGVEVYKTHFEALDRAGGLDILSPDAAILIRPDLYDRQTGLALDVESGQGWMY